MIFLLAIFMSMANALAPPSSFRNYSAIDITIDMNSPDIMPAKYVELAQNWDGITGAIDIFLTVKNGQCWWPILTFVFDMTDFNSASEYLLTYGANGTFLETCRGEQCGRADVTCFDRLDAGTDLIEPDQPGLIFRVEQTSAVHELGCHRNLTISGEVMIGCRRSSILPTPYPSQEPTFDPTSDPTYTPAPSAETASPTMAPTDSYRCINQTSLCYDRFITATAGQEVSITADILGSQGGEDHIVTFEVDANGNDCTNPNITFLYESIDYRGGGWWQCLNVSTDWDQLLYITKKRQCGIYQKQEMQVPNKIAAGSSIQYEVSPCRWVDDQCQRGIVVNASMTLTCSPDATASPSTEPTGSPTSSPSAETMAPTPSPTYELCGTNTYCQYVDVWSVQGVVNSYVYDIGHLDNSAHTFWEFDITNVGDDDCHELRIDFDFLPIDNDSGGEELQIVFNDSLIETCGHRDVKCDAMKRCIDDIVLVQDFAVNETVSVVVMKPSSVDNFCQRVTENAIEAVLTVKCDGGSLSPTQEPTREPTSETRDPSVSPTPFPSKSPVTASPTLNPTNFTANPTTVLGEESTLGGVEDKAMWNQYMVSMLISTIVAGLLLRL